MSVPASLDNSLWNVIRHRILELGLNLYPTFSLWKLCESPYPHNLHAWFNYFPARKLLSRLCLKSKEGSLPSSDRWVDPFLESGKPRLRAVVRRRGLGCVSER